MLALRVDQTEARLTSSLRRVMYRSMRLIGDVVEGEGAVAEAQQLRAQMEKHSTALADAADAETVVKLSELAFRRIEAVVGNLRDRQSETRTELARALALVRETIAMLGQDSDPYASSVDRSVDRLEALTRIDSLQELRRQLAGEVLQLRQVAIERRAHWAGRAAALETKVTSLEHDLVSVRQEASSDALTGLGNRRQFERVLEEHLASPPAQLIVAVLDVDDLKATNDTLGHGAGDRVLQRVADSLRAALREEDIVARIGGDEFAAIAFGLTLRQAEHMLRGVVAALAAGASEPGIAVTVSCGAVERTAGDSLRTIMSRADSALYDAKRLGKNRVTTRSPPYIRDLRPVH